MFNWLALEIAGGFTLGVAATLLTVADMIRGQPSRGTRLPLGQIQQNIQRPTSVPNLKSLFIGKTKTNRDENRDIEKAAQSEYLPSTYVPLVRKGLPKRTTTIFRDPILKTVEEVNATVGKGTPAPSAATIEDDSVVPTITATLEDALQNLPASQCESIIASTKDITLAQPDANQHIVISDVASAPQTIDTGPPALPQISEPEILALLEAAHAAEQYTNPPALPNLSEPSVQITSVISNNIETQAGLPALSATSEPEFLALLEIAHAAEQYTNLLALPNNSEPSVQDASVISNSIETQTKSPALSATSEPVIHTISSSSELNSSLVVKKSRGPIKRYSNPALPMAVDIGQAISNPLRAPEQNATRSVSHAAVHHDIQPLPIPMISEERSPTVLRHDVQQPLVTVKEALIAASAHNTTTEVNPLRNVSVSVVPMAFKEHRVSALYGNAPAPTTSTVHGPDVPLHLEVNMNKAPVVKTRKSSLEDGPPLRDPNDPKGLRAAVANSIKASASRPWKPSPAPTDAQRVSVKKRRDATLRVANYPQPMPWAPALQHPGSHQHIGNCAAPSMLGPKAVEPRYLTPYCAVPSELYGLDTAIEGLYGADEAKADDGYDSYDEDDGYVTAPSFRSNGETTNDAATTDFYPRWNQKARREIAEAMALVESSRTQEDVDDEAMDPTMVAEYADEIFAHLRELELKMLPNPFYMEDQTELQWSMRAVLMDWLVQVHGRCNLLPETLFICANFVDRFLSGKIVSLGKLQLVGATALFLAAKKEEINCPTLSEIVFMVDNTYTSDELIKAERYMLNILSWELEYPGPMSFLRRISKADDYDLETRTLAKYFLEVTLMEERFIGTPCSFIAAASHCIARLLLGKGLWTPHHVYYSNYTYLQLHPLLQMLLHCVENPLKHHAAVYEKYADKRYKRASSYVQIELQRGFVLPDPPMSSTRNVVDDIVAPYATTPYYNNPFSYHLATGPASGRVFST
jgi:Cyclin, N-terminal domain/Cyclin, C-terminal domain